MLQYISAQEMCIRDRLGLIYALIAFGGMLLFAPQGAMLFLDPTEPELATLVDLTAQYIRTLTAFFFPLALVNIVRFSIQGMGFSGLAILAGVMEMIARTAVGVIFVPMFGYTAACFASPAAWVCADLFLIPACMGSICLLYTSRSPGCCRRSRATPAG